MDEHWTEDREDFTPEMKTAYSKYETEADAFKGGHEAMKAVGVPFKLPEHLDKLPDDATRAEFVAQVGKLQGAIENEDGLKDINFTTGMAEGSKANEELVKAVSEFAVQNKMPKALLQKLVEFNNNYSAGITKQRNQQVTDAAEATNKALIEKFGTAEAVKEKSELVRRVFQNQAGLSAEEYESVGDELAASVFTKNPILSRALVTLLAPMAKEGESEEGGGVGGKDKEKGEVDTTKGIEKTRKDLGWKP